MFETLISLAVNFLKWLASPFIKAREKEKERELETREMVIPLQADITRIRKEGLKKDANEYTLLDKYLHSVKEPIIPEYIQLHIDGLFKGFPESLGDEYDRVKDKLGKFGDRILIMDIHDCYDVFKQWKSEHQKIRDKDHEYTEDLELSLAKCRAHVEWIDRKARKIEDEIDKIIG